MELLCHKVDVHLSLQDTAEEFSIVNLAFQVPINGAGELFYISTNIWYCRSFLIWAILVEVNGISLWF